MSKSNILTEDLGKQFEMCLCLIFNTNYDGKYKYSLDKPNEIKEMIDETKFLKLFSKRYKHTAKNGGVYDFTSEDGKCFISAKTSKGKSYHSKIAPQVIGQCQPEKLMKLLQRKFINISKLKEYIQKYPERILRIMFDNTFDIKCPIVFYNEKIRQIICIKLKKEIILKNLEFSWTCDYKDWKNSSTLKVKFNDKLISLAEFQFHSKSRTNMANRFFFENVLEVFHESFEIIDLSLYNFEKENDSEKMKIHDKDKNIIEVMSNDLKDITVKNINGIKLLESLENNSVDLVLTDPPYIISRDSGMNTHYNTVKENEENNIEFVKTEKEWLEYKKEKKLKDDSKKENYMKYGTIYGKKYCVKTDYGDWDENFTMKDLEKFVKLFYQKLRKGGTCIIWFDLWKITPLYELLEKYKFKQIRFIEWIKTNPQPLNSKTNYLTNCREIALLAVKGGKPTFNSKYDNALYQYPLQGGKDRFHPTQKSLPLFEELIQKHSNEGDTVIDPFLGSGTTALASIKTKRKFIGSELNKEYFDKMTKILKRNSNKSKEEDL